MLIEDVIYNEPLAYDIVIFLLCWKKPFQWNDLHMVFKLEILVGHSFDFFIAQGVLFYSSYKV